LASVAQRLDGNRLTGSLRFPERENTTQRGRRDQGRLLPATHPSPGSHAPRWIRG